MCCIPAKVAGVGDRGRYAATPTAGLRVILAAASMAGANEVYAMGGAQAIAALALGTERDRTGGRDRRPRQPLRPGGEAPACRSGRNRRDRRPQRADGDRRGHRECRWMALDLCAQAEHGEDGLLVAAAVETVILDAIQESVARIAEERESTKTPRWHSLPCRRPRRAWHSPTRSPPSTSSSLTEDAELLTQRVTTPAASSSASAAPRPSATTRPARTTCCPRAAPAASRGRSGRAPSGAGSSTVEITPDAARELAPTVATLARAEGFPVHAESAWREGAPQAKPRSDPIDWKD